MKIQTGEPIVFTYTHSNGNQYWERSKEGIFLTETKDDKALVYLLGSMTTKKVELEKIKRKEDIFNLEHEYMILTQPNRVNASKIFSWKQVKKLIEKAKRESKR